MIEIFYKNMTIVEYLTKENRMDEKKVRAELEKEAEEEGIEANGLQIVQHFITKDGGVLFTAYLKDPYEKSDLQKPMRSSFN